jgi:hypothetical protein
VFGVCCSDPSVFSTGGGGGAVTGSHLCVRRVLATMVGDAVVVAGCGRGREVQVIKDGWDNSDVMADALLTEGLIIVAVVEPREPKSGAQRRMAAMHACSDGARRPVCSADAAAHALIHPCGGCNGWLVRRGLAAVLPASCTRADGGRGPADGD